MNKDLESRKELFWWRKLSEAGTYGRGSGRRGKMSQKTESRGEIIVKITQRCLILRTFTKPLSWL